MTMRFAIVTAGFYEDLAARLRSSALATLAEAGHSDVEQFVVPGAFELPLAASWLADSGRFAGIACLGAVIRGETSHYDLVCAEVARGITDVALRTGTPCAFGVLTCENLDQALARAGGDKRDQGRMAAEALLAMSSLRKQVDSIAYGQDLP
jgi:6,7-dimethyl-8-ribityllumazine synthase